MTEWSMIVSIVGRGRGEKISQAAVIAGAGGGTLLLGQGTAPNAILHFLGLGDTSKDIVVNIVEEKKLKEVGNAICESAKAIKGAGIAFCSSVECFVRSGEAGTTQWRKNEMDKQSEETAVVVIVNKDYAEDALAAARKAGARGGTVLSGRGTASESDAAFFGVKLVPEKDILVIVTKGGEAEKIIEEIRKSPSFAEKGSGIIFAIKAMNFVQIGH